MQGDFLQKLRLAVAGTATGNPNLIFVPIRAILIVVTLWMIWGLKNG